MENLGFIEVCGGRANPIPGKHALVTVYRLTPLGQAVIAALDSSQSSEQRPRADAGTRRSGSGRLPHKS